MKRIYYIFVFTIFINACKKDDASTTSTPANQYFVSNSVLATLTKAQILEKPIFQANSTFKSFVAYDVTAYKIIYKTKNVDGKAINASGVLIVPKTTNALAVVSQQHVTIQNNSQAPTSFSNDGEASNSSVALASLGYIVAVPDYIGYGESSNVLHTYQHREGLSTACLDMLRATKEFIAQEKINWNTNVLLTGYSEGGYATLALQKLIEEKYPSEFNLKGSSCGAGAYNGSAFMKEIIGKPSSGNPSYNAFYTSVLTTYHTLYAISRPLTSIIKDEYLVEVQKGINSNLALSFNLIFKDEFKAGILNGTDTEMLNTFKDNDIFDWKPITPTKLFHGTSDNAVFYLNSETAFAAMKARGGNVELIPISGKGHSDSVGDYLLGTLAFFNSINQ